MTTSHPDAKPSEGSGHRVGSKGRAFGAALVWSQGSLDAAWQWIRDLPWLVEGTVWLLVLPVVLGLWVWQTSWPLMLRLVLVIRDRRLEPAGLSEAVEMVRAASAPAQCG